MSINYRIKRLWDGSVPILTANILESMPINYQLNRLWGGSVPILTAGSHLLLCTKEAQQYHCYLHESLPNAFSEEMDLGEASTSLLTTSLLPTAR